MIGSIIIRLVGGLNRVILRSSNVVTSVLTTALTIATARIAWRRYGTLGIRDGLARGRN